MTEQRHGRRVARCLLALLAAAAATCCGTTVPLSRVSMRQTAPGGAGELSGPQRPAAPAGAPAATSRRSGATSSLGDGNPQPAAGAPTIASPAPASRAGRGVPAAGAAAPGVTASTISIGFAYQANLDAYNKALGGGKITSGDQPAEAAILVRDLNAHGGIAGRRVLLDSFAYDAQSTQPYAVQDQAACAHFTQDHPVFAVVGGGLTADFEQCMERAGTSVIGADIVRFGRDDFARYRHYFDVQELDLDRLGAALATRLAADGYFTGWDAALGRPASGGATTGIVTFDDAAFRAAVAHQLLPGLARHGISVAGRDVVFIPQPASQTDDGPAASDIQSAVLRFRQDHVDHVILIDTHSGITQIFLNAADSQGYRPRYGVESGSGIQALLDAGIIRGSQLAGIDGLGWIPALDLPNGADPDSGPYSSPDRRACMSVMAAHGQTFSSTNAASIALLYCDAFALLQRALATSSSVTAEGLRQGIERLGGRAPDASLGAATYRSGKHEAVARAFQWVFDGTAMRYSSRAQAIS